MSATPIQINQIRKIPISNPRPIGDSATDHDLKHTSGPVLTRQSCMVTTLTETDNPYIRRVHNNVYTLCMSPHNQHSIFLTLTPSSNLNSESAGKLSESKIRNYQVHAGFDIRLSLSLEKGSIHSLTISVPKACLTSTNQSSYTILFRFTFTAEQTKLNPFAATMSGSN